MWNSKIMRILAPIDIKSLSMNERICHILIFTVPLLLFGIAMSTTMPGDWFVILLWVLYFILFSPWYFYLLAYEKLEKKYKVESDIRFGNTYEFFSKFMVSFVPGIIITVMTITYLMDKVFLGLVISSAFIIPSLALYFRDDVFNDESCIDGEDIIIGYIPTGYGLLSVAIGLFGYINAFKQSSPTLAAGLIIVTLIFQILAFVPDKFNNVLPFEVRRTEGYLLLLFSLGIIFLLICHMITGYSFISLKNIDLSFEGIVRKSLTWGTGIIIAILFVRKIKSMSRK